MKKRKITLKMYSDPGHGWLAVPKKYIEELNLWGVISGYSYMNGNTVYLEEDCDAGHFLDVAEIMGWDVQIEYRYTDRSSRIRNYTPYKKEDSHDICAVHMNAG